MAWEKRTASRRYFYQVRRVEGHVRRTYLGGGQAAHTASAALDDAKRTRACEREMLLAEYEHWQPIEDLLVDLDEACTLLITATLSAAGYYRHDRGKWRRRGAVKQR